MLNEVDLVRGCRNFNYTAQRELYLRFAGKMRGVCIKYSSSSDEAKDILQEGFIKVYNKIEGFSGNGSLEGWIRRIMVNTAINFYKKNKKRKMVHNPLESDTDFIDETGTDETEVSDLFSMVSQADFSEEELQDCLKKLEESYRIIFNLFCFENYSHADIAQALSIDERTSRIRLFRARKMLKDHLYKLSAEKIKKYQKNN
jgi:RNA polymerase sigma-70 factor, ECF subfamily